MNERRWFAPAVLAGVVGAGLAALGGTQTWGTVQGSAAGMRVEASVPGSDVAPLVFALALVSLAAWGVVLVSRGQARRVVAVLGLLACVGMLVATYIGLGNLQHALDEAVQARGASPESISRQTSSWVYLSGAGGVLALVAFLVAVAQAPRWPAMGKRYDAPTAPADQSEPDMWRALDQGEDPTS